MALESLLSLPRWLYVGVFAGLLLSVGCALAFLVAGRLFPDRATPTGQWRSTEERRRTEIRQYLTEIGETFVENKVIAGERVAFYLPRRDVVVTFDAKAYLALEPTPTDVILAEHEMPGPALGTRLPFPTPDPARTKPSETRHTQRWRATPPSDASSTAYAELGIDGDADIQTVRHAYRERLKDVHPDHGGTEEELKRVRDAYHRLTDGIS